MKLLKWKWRLWPKRSCDRKSVSMLEEKYPVQSCFYEVDKFLASTIIDLEKISFIDLGEKSLLQENTYYLTYKEFRFMSFF